jgi:hypothetical protein
MAPAVRVMRVQRGAAVLALLAAACEKQPPPPASGAGFPATRSAVSSSRSVERMWDNSLGSIIATVSVENGLPIVYVSDSMRVGTMEAELFSHDTQVVQAVFEVKESLGGCGWKKVARLVSPPADARSTTWSLALSPGVGRPIAVDAIAELAPRDSSSFAIRLSRLASTLPDDSISAPFRGLPVVVRDAWRFHLADGTPVAVAVAMRTMNVESNPRAEMVTIVAELDPTSNSGAWRASWTRRDAGPEDRIEGADLLAALELGDGHPVVVFVREGDRGLQLEFVERLAGGSWHTRWGSAALSCVIPPV